MSAATLERFFDPETGAVEAKRYLATRPIDADKLRQELLFRLRTGFVHCRIYGHSIIIETVPGSLHAYPIWGEFLPRGDYEPETMECIEQAMAFILAVNW